MKRYILLLFFTHQAFCMQDTKEPREQSDDFGRKVAEQALHLMRQPRTCEDMINIAMLKLISPDQTKQGTAVKYFHKKAELIVKDDILIEEAAERERLHGNISKSRVTVEEIKRLKKAGPRGCLDECCLATYYKGMEDVYWLHKANERVPRIMSKLNEVTTKAPETENQMKDETE